MEKRDERKAVCREIVLARFKREGLKRDFKIFVEFNGEIEVEVSAFNEEEARELVEEDVRFGKYITDNIAGEEYNVELDAFVGSCECVDDKGLDDKVNEMVGGEGQSYLFEPYLPIAVEG